VLCLWVEACAVSGRGNEIHFLEGGHVHRTGHVPVIGLEQGEVIGILHLLTARDMNLVDMVFPEKLGDFSSDIRLPDSLSRRRACSQDAHVPVIGLEQGEVIGIIRLLTARDMNLVDMVFPEKLGDFSSDIRLPLMRINPRKAR